MRCYCCNRLLNEFESTLKDTAGNYLDTCNKCLDGLNIETIGRQDLNPNEETNDDDWCDEEGCSEDDYRDLFAGGSDEDE